jgi:hypothetical protein
MSDYKKLNKEEQGSCLVIVELTRALAKEYKESKPEEKTLSKYLTCEAVLIGKTQLNLRTPFVNDLFKMFRVEFCKELNPKVAKQSAEKYDILTGDIGKWETDFFKPPYSYIKELRSDNKNIEITDLVLIKYFWDKIHKDLFSEVFRLIPHDRVTDSEFRIPIPMDQIEGFCDEQIAQYTKEIETSRKKVVLDIYGNGIDLAPCLEFMASLVMKNK